MDKITKRKASEAEDIDSNDENNIKDIDSTNNKKTKKNKQNKQSKKEKVVKPEEKFCSLYVEAESDDEYAKENFMFPTTNNENDSDDERRRKRNKKLMKKHKENNIESSSSSSPPIEATEIDNNVINLDDNNDDDDQGEMKPTTDTSSEDDDERSADEQSDEDEDDDIEYRIQYILDARLLPASEWRPICLLLDTREVTRGSVLKQPDHEFYDNSPQVIEKFLIKWVHASFIHLSWETEKDLLDLCGVTAKGITLYIHVCSIYTYMLYIYALLGHL